LGPAGKTLSSEGSPKIQANLQNRQYGGRAGRHPRLYDCLADTSSASGAETRFITERNRGLAAIALFPRMLLANP
jgi:hypothetical protein